jgi:hypothetical protein
LVRETVQLPRPCYLLSVLMNIIGYPIAARSPPEIASFIDNALTYVVVPGKSSKWAHVTKKR